MTLLLIYGFVSIFFSFLCSILEAVLLSVSPTFIKIKINEGEAFAKTLEQLKEDVDKPLIAILTVNTIAHTVGAILVGVQSEKAFGTGNNIVGIVSAIMTFLILVVSEIIPKTIGATYWKQLANFTSKILTIMIFPLKWTGIIWLMQITTKLVGKSSHGNLLSREDFTAMTEIAVEKGVFEESESKIIKNLLSFKSVLAKHIMTPRTVMKLTSEDHTIEEYYNNNKDIQFSRIPIYSDSPENITGYILKDEVFKNLVENHNSKTLSELKRKIIIETKDTPIPELFEKFIESKEHIALIVDEFGSVSGIVTMEDVIETLLGLEIVDEQDTHEDMQLLARNKWEERAKKHGLLKDGKE
jgi:magnesium and cobalt exporter, CNNM family